MINLNYANAYKEVLVIINNLVKQDYDKIPKEYIEFLKNNCNNDYDFKYDNSKSFEEQELLDATKYILFDLFEKYGSTQMQKDKIKAFRNNYNYELEKNKRKKYNYDNIFPNNQSNFTQNESSINSLEFIENKSSLFKKILNKIKKILKK